MLYIKLQTNRAKIKELLNQFSRNLTLNEKFIVPRPLPRENFRFYFGYAQVKKDSKNYHMIMKIKNHSFLDKIAYNSQINSIEFSWKSPSESI